MVQPGPKINLVALIGSMTLFSMLLIVGMGFMVVGWLANELSVAGASAVFMALTFYLFRRLPGPTLAGAALGMTAGAVGGYAVALVAGPLVGKIAPPYGAAVMGALAGPIIVAALISPIGEVMAHVPLPALVRASMLLIPMGLGAVFGYFTLQDWFAHTLPAVVGVTFASGAFGELAGITIGAALAYWLAA